MPLDVDADLSRFDELLEWFLERVVISDAELERLVEDARRDAWLIANHAQARMVQDAIDAANRGEGGDSNFGDVIAALLALLLLRWGKAPRPLRRAPRERRKDRRRPARRPERRRQGRDRGGGSRAPRKPGAALPSYRLRAAWVNGVQRFYNRGRYNAHISPGFTKLRPMWLFDAVLDGKTTVICQERNGVMLEALDPWWTRNYPPLHPYCRSAIRALSAAEAARRKPRDPLITEPPTQGFGDAYNPGSPAHPFDAKRMDPAIQIELLRKQAERA